MPGVGESIETYAPYKALYQAVLPKADAILWVHPADDRMIMFIRQVCQDLFVGGLGHLGSKVVFGLSKADAIYPHDWWPQTNTPSRLQLANLDGRRQDFEQLVRPYLPAWRGEPVYYSSEKRFNLEKLFRRLLESVPPERRWVLEQRMSIADFAALVDKQELKRAEGIHVDPPPPPQAPRGSGAPVGPLLPDASDSLPQETGASAQAQRVLPREVAAHLANLSQEQLKALIDNPNAFHDWVTSIGR